MDGDPQTQAPKADFFKRNNIAYPKIPQVMAADDALLN